MTTTSPDGGTDVIGLPVADAGATVRDFLVSEALLGVAGLAIATLAGGSLVRREVRPLERVAAARVAEAVVQSHGGTITVGSTPGSTVCTVALPAA